MRKCIEYSEGKAHSGAIRVVFLLFVSLNAKSTMASRAVSPIPPPLSLGGIAKGMRERWDFAKDFALLEQSVEDYNADVVATAPDVISSLAKRRLIVLPLDERFEPPPGMFSNGHVQTGDKMSLPKTFWAAIQKSSAEVK